VERFSALNKKRREYLLYHKKHYNPFEDEELPASRNCQVADFLRGW
jgi:hypothetical protein